MREQGLSERLRVVNWWIVLLITLLAGFGAVILYSVAGGAIQPWAVRHASRFLVLLGLMLLVATVDLRYWLKIAYPGYAICLILLVAVEVTGKIGGGSQRWIDLGVVRIQPSEFMKLAVLFAIARYYHYLPKFCATQVHRMVPPLVLMAVPAALVIIQPDLGTGLTICMGAAVVMFLAGAPLWVFFGGAAAVMAAAPIVWMGLRDYQKGRVLTFLDPARDPLGAGYHITQSTIAIGSGGVLGKGYLQGTQSHLKFLPEMHTDFIFAMMVEEWGMVGGLAVLLGFGVLIGWGTWVSLTSNSHFGRLLSAGMSAALFFYVAINMLMVMGLAPVVGVPLPLISYGGSAMMTALIALGVIMSCERGREGRGMH